MHTHTHALTHTHTRSWKAFNGVKACTQVLLCVHEQPPQPLVSTAHQVVSIVNHMHTHNLIDDNFIIEKKTLGTLLNYNQH